MDAKLKQRLVGAAVIAALIFITLAILLKNNNPAQQESLTAKSSALAGIPTANNTTNSQSSNDQQNLADNNPAQIAQTNIIPSPDSINASNSTNNQPNAVTTANNPIANQNVNNQAVANPATNTSSTSSTNNSTTQNVNNAVPNNQTTTNPKINAASASANNNSAAQNVNNAASNNQAMTNTDKTIADNNVIVNSENAASNGTQTIPAPTSNNNDQPSQNTSQNQIALNQSTDDQTSTAQTPTTNSIAANPSTISNNPSVQQKIHKKVSHKKTGIKNATTVVAASANSKQREFVALNTTSHGTKNWAVQVGSFKDVSNAKALSKELIAHHYTTYMVTFNTSKGLRTHVYAGAKSLDKASAKNLVAQLQKTMNINAILVSAPSKTTKVKKVSLTRKKSSSVVEDSSTNV